MTYGDGKFVAIETSNTWNRAAYSEDGIHWNMANFRYSDVCTKVVYGNGKFVATSSNYGTYSYSQIIYSEDGINWKKTNLPIKGRPVTNIVYGNGKFVAVTGIGSSSSEIIYSEDGITWKPV